MKPIKDIWPLDQSDTLALFLVIMAYVMFGAGWFAGYDAASDIVWGSAAVDQVTR